MKSFLCIFGLLFVPLLVQAAPPMSIKEPYYMYQAGVSGGVCIAGSPVNGVGFHFGGMARWSNHVFGATYERENNEYHGAVTKHLQHTKAGGYYSFTFPGEHFQWGPLVGAGKLTYDYKEVSGQRYVNTFVDTDTYFEMGIYGLGGARGNGIGGKVAVTFSAIEKFVSFTLYVQTGWAWNQK